MKVKIYYYIKVSLFINIYGYIAESNFQFLHETEPFQLTGCP